MLKRVFRFCTLESKVFCVFESQNISERIRNFKEISISTLLQISEQSERQKCFNHKSSQLNIKQPSFLKFHTSKQLGQFIQKEQISVNVRILHALCHIEYNAFMSYTDTCVNLAGYVSLPKRHNFIEDMRKIALEEGSHFELLQNRLLQLGYRYGDIPVIDQLSKSIFQTREGLLRRIAIISMVHEGRGLQAVKKLIRQLEAIKDKKTISVLQVIQKQEVHHYTYGLKWFKQICTAENKTIEEAIEEVNKISYQKLDLEKVRKDIANNLSSASS